MEVNLEETFHMYLNCLTQFFKQEAVIHLKKVYNNFFWCHFNLIKNNHLINGVLCNGYISCTVRKSVNAYNIYIIYIQKIYVIYMIYIYIIIKTCNHENNLLFWLLPQPPAHMMYGYILLVPMNQEYSTSKTRSIT